MKKNLTVYLHGGNFREFHPDFWDEFAPQWNKARYWLYEVPVDLEIDMETGDAIVTHVFGVELTKEVKA